MSMQQTPVVQEHAEQRDETPSIRIASLHDLAQFQICVDLQVAVWGYSEGDVIPRRVFLLADRIGGQVLGAFDGEKIVGFAMGLPGYRNGQPYLHSHMLAVLPEYRNLGLGRRLKLAQRDDALARGFELMEWTFDPLEIKNAHLNIARLGAISRRYKPDFYGPSSSPLQGGLPTDRLYAEWWLRSPRVTRILNETGPEQQTQAISEEVIVPHELYQWKQAEATRNLASARQLANREALQSAFSRGLAIVGYRRESNGDGHFLLGTIDSAEIAPNVADILP
ncbi:GNAT family N-acetyltransferase [Granulicella sp. dw_53]|uniref:GNAT family N-acetyltransferase n=1 Tax=Granulicella sp. dw_53 TaxID=2719792 RepID=UPI0021056589|nr:GNAT family N-acetyltransferase [Granulicella sp. dw_53]